jgi:hypothetical protein
MARRNFWLEEDLAKALDELKRRDGVPLTVSIKRAVEDYLHKTGIVKGAR